MHKGMLSGLWSLKWVLLCLLLSGCPGTEKPPTPTPIPTPIPPPPSPSPEITVTGQIMLGPVVRGHSLQIVIYDTEMNELIRPKIGLDGGYGFTLKDYEGGVIAQVTSTKPQQECSAGDYIDEATAKPKCLGNNTILSATVLKRDDDNNENQAKLHTTPVTTVAAINAGIGIRNDGTITVAEKLKETTITQSNKTIARALGLGDQSVAEYKPSSIITTNQKFQSCNAYCLALASLSGAEAEGQSLNDITRKISSNLNDEGKLGASIEDMMIRGIQKVAEKVQATSASTTDYKTILTNLSNYQYKFKNSKLSVDLTKTLPRQPKFINDNTTINREPTWGWESGGTGNKRYRYILKNYGSQDWTTSDESYFKQDTQLKPGKYTLLVQEGDLNDKDVWSKVSESTIEVVDLDKVKIGEGLITGKLLQGTLLRVDIGNIKDPNGVKKDSISYQWILDGELINPNKGEFSLNQDQVGKNINVIVRYEDLLNKFHYIKSNISEKIKDVKVNGIPPTVIDAIESGAQLIDGDFDINKTLSDTNMLHSSTSLTFVITALPSRGVIINNDGSEITKIENGEYQEVSKGFKYKRTQAGKDSFKYKGKRDNILSLKSATVNISYKNKAPNASAFKISAAAETETSTIPFADKITDDQDLTEWLIITDHPQAGDLYIDGVILDSSKLETLIHINSNVTYKSRDASNNLDSFKYVAIDKDDERSDEKKVSIEFIFFKVTDTKPNKFPVCWGEKIDAISSAKFSDFKDKVRQILLKSWSAYAMVDFVGWGNCETNDSRETTKIQFADSGTDYFSRADNRILFTKVTVNYLIPDSIVVHEFGHLLGLMHEHARYDSYRYGSIKKDKNKKYCKDLEAGGPRKMDSELINYLEFKTKHEYDYDPYSIMNYCGIFRFTKGKLSLTDIKKVQKKYGPRADSLMMFKEKPFTGFYKSSVNFTYYQYGKLENSGDNIAFIIQPNETAEYLNIKHANGMNTLVNYSKKEKLQNKTLIPLSDNAISICKLKLNTANTAEITPLSTCTVFEEKNYVDYRAFYFNSQSNTYNQVMKSFCQKLQGDETPWSKSQNFKQKQYFVSLTNCINFSSYFNDDSSDWRLYFKGVGYNGRIKDLEGYYFIDGLMFKDEYKNINGFTSQI